VSTTGAFYEGGADLADLTGLALAFGGLTNVVAFFVLSTGVELMVFL